MTTLDSLLSDAFIASAGVLTSPRGARRFLLQSPVVRRIRDAVRTGELTEPAIRRFVQRLGSDFTKGFRFPHELALAALAVALEDRKTAFVEELLLDLTRLDIIEMPLSPHVARECLKRWKESPTTTTRVFRPRTTNTLVGATVARTTWSAWVVSQPGHGARNIVRPVPCGE